jgi:hypothetical protein
MAKGVALKSGSVLLPSVGMSQSTVMLGALLAGFVVWLAMNGKLQAYWSLLLGGGATSSSTGAAIVPGTETTGTPGLAWNPFAGLPSSWHDFIFGAPAPAAPAAGAK